LRTPQAFVAVLFAFALGSQAHPQPLQECFFIPSAFALVKLACLRPPQVFVVVSSAFVFDSI